MTDPNCSCGHPRASHPRDEECGRCDCDGWRDPWAAHIKEIVDKAPPLSAGQRSKLALLLKIPRD